jgi:hypothetical protein
MTTEPKRYTADAPFRYLSLGWGVQSFTLAAMIALEELPPVDAAIHADTGHEALGTYTHAARWTPWLEEHGVKIVTVKAQNTSPIPGPSATNNMTRKGIWIPAYSLNPTTGAKGQINRACTDKWKITPVRRFIRTQIGKTSPECVEAQMGISLDEWHRMKTSNVKYIKNIYPLVDARISRANCVAWLESKGLEVPPKSSCTFCPYHSLETWRVLKRNGGPDWEEAVTVDAELRSEVFSEDLEMYLHPHNKPLSEAVDIPEDHGFQQLELEMPCDSGNCFV